MEYTIGSVADLISGKKTPNKPKVQKLIIEQAPPQPAQQISLKSKAEKKKKRRIGLTTNDSDMVVINHKMIGKLPLDAATEKPDSNEESSRITKKRKREGSVDRIVSNKKLKKKRVEIDDKKTDNPVSNERNSRTVFVGNVPVTIKKRQLLRLFSKFGHIESVRLRGVAPAEPGISKRLAVKKNLLHPKRLTIHSYVTFALQEDALKALELNGTKYKEHHIRVQIANDTQHPDPHKAIFVGNLPFDIEDDELWSAFESCGPIVSVRVVRHSATNMGIGIAYVNFESSDAVELALQMDDVTIKKNVVRIQRYSQKKKHGKRHERDERNKKPPHLRQVFKRSKNATDSGIVENNSENQAKAVKVKVGSSAFEGSKSNIKKKKNKINKGVAKKMKLINKIAPR